MNPISGDATSNYEFLVLSNRHVLESVCQQACVCLPHVVFQGGGFNVKVQNCNVVLEARFTICQQASDNVVGQAFTFPKI